MYKCFFSKKKSVIETLIDGRYMSQINSMLGTRDTDVLLLFSKIKKSTYVKQEARMIFLPSSLSLTTVVVVVVGTKNKSPYRCRHSIDIFIVPNFAHGLMRLIEELQGLQRQSHRSNCEMKR
jgi:hypothetical protein